MSSISSSLSAELRYQHASRYVLIAAGAAVLAVVATVVQLRNRAEHLVDLFARSLSQAEQEGVRLEDALAAPVRHTSADGVNSVDNVLRFDYENAVAGLTSLNPGPTAVHTLEFSTFIVFPVIFACYGIVVSTYDYRFKTLKVKASAHGRSQVMLAKALSLLAITGVVIVSTLIAAWLLATVSSRFFALDTPEELPGATLNRAGGLLPGLGIAVASCLFFGVLGLALGTIFRSAVAPLIGFLVVNFIVPILIAFDPRNLVAVLGHHAFTFEGSFQLVEPRGMPALVAALALVAISAALMAVAWLLFSRRSAYVR